MILRAADGGIDGEILHRLHEELDARNTGDLAAEAGRMTAVALMPALVARLQIDQETAAVQRHVGAVDADEGA